MTYIANQTPFELLMQVPQFKVKVKLFRVRVSCKMYSLAFEKIKYP